MLVLWVYVVSLHTCSLCVLLPWHCTFQVIHISHMFVCVLHGVLLQGLKRIKDSLADEALDAPGAPAAFKKLLDQAATEGWLPPEMSS